MKPQGQKPVNFPSKTDHHIRKKHRVVGNWWDDIGFCNKKADRQKAANDIMEDIEEEFNSYCEDHIKKTTFNRFE